ncbi:MAG: aminopeptidase P family protein [Lawsonella sp.]
MNLEQRRNKLRQQINQMVADNELQSPDSSVLDYCDGILVLSHASIRYYSGFSGSNGLLWLDAGNPQHDILFTDSRYTEQAKQQCGELAVVVTSKRGGEVLSTLDPLPSSIAVEGTALSWPDYVRLDELLHSPHMADISTVISRQRCVKDATELEKLQKAATCAEQALKELVEAGTIRAGVTERYVAAQLDFLMGKNGSEGPSFDTIVAAGANAALPHHEPDNTVLKEGDLVVIDFGATVDGYKSDCTRTFSIGKLSDWQEEICATVLEAHETALAQVEEGVLAGDIDKAARDIISQAGYGDKFGHSTGHGVGLDVHESPYVRTGGTEPLEAGSVFTIEPGIYLPDKGGVRIENTYALLADGTVHSFQQYSLKVQVV